MLGLAALLGPWAAHLACGSSSFHDLATALPRPARLPHRKARSRDGAVASRSTPAMKPAHLFVGAGRANVSTPLGPKSTSFLINGNIACARPVRTTRATGASCPVFAGCRANLGRNRDDICLRSSPPCGNERRISRLLPMIHIPVRCRSSVVEHFIGNEEVDSSILSGSTTASLENPYLSAVGFVSPACVKSKWKHRVTTRRYSL